jgi:NADH-quinone oxidoreductase subunit M
MFSAFDNFPALLIWLPLAGALLSFFVRSETAAKTIALLVSFLSLGVVVASLFYSDAKFHQLTQVSYVWLPGIGSSFALMLDGLTTTLCMLTALVFPMIFLLIRKGRFQGANNFYGLMLLTQCGLMGVFMAADALVFYLFWELALIPVYFLSSIWGGEKRIKATFKFFIYTFLGSLFLLIGILYLHLHNNTQSFSIIAFYGAELSATEQTWLFLLFFVAFAIKMPIFPFHTWQPDAYEQAPTPVTMVLSAVMVKMGLFGVLRWLIPLFPLAVKNFNTTIIIVVVIGMIYASLIAIYQDNLKKLIAYSSIAHIGLMAAGAFTLAPVAIEGLLVQMFNHGINIMALWIVADIIEQQTGTNKISALGGIAKKAPMLTVFLVIAAFANIALPLTNAFVGEFMIFNGLYQFKPWIAALAGVSIILSAVYTLNMIKNVFYGEPAAAVTKFTDISRVQVSVLSVLTIFILIAGIYPTPMFEFISDAVGPIINKYNPK